MCDLADKKEIAAEVGCSVANIDKVLRKHGLKRGKARQKAGLSKAWNKGLTKEDDERLKTQSERRKGEGNPMYGVKAWNKGLTKEEDQRVREISKKMAGRVVSDEHRAKLAKAKLGLRASDANNWKYGRSVTTSGYVYRSLGNKNVYEHRWVASQILKNVLSVSLADDDHVHHVDRDKENNSPENLIVLDNSSHLKLHAAVDSVDKQQQLRFLKDSGLKFFDCGELANSLTVELIDISEMTESDIES